MMMQDPNPLPWGAQDRFQAHFIVRRDTSDYARFVARTVLDTSGHFGSKKVTAVKWNGGEIADILNADTELNKKIAANAPRDADIWIEPTGKGVRIRGRWKNHLAFGITKEAFQIYDKIAGHIKSLK